MSNAYTQSLNRLVDEFQKLPGIGARTAERLAFHLLKQPTEEAMQLAHAIQEVKTQIRHCSRCFNLTEQNLCEICQDANREHDVICVVEQPNDLISLEETGACRWVYHVLLGHLAPLEGVTPDDLTIDALVERVESGEIREIVMATNPNMEGDGTALYISSLLERSDISLTRLARGLATGGSIEYANKSSLNDAITGRAKMN
jgi:recombination protein RecR